MFFLMRSTIPAVALLLLAPPLSAAQPWEKVAEDDGITVWSREVPDSPVLEVKAQTVMKIDIERVWTVVSDVDHFAEFMPYVEEARVLAKEGDSAVVIYQRIDPPMVQQRDYALRVQFKRDTEKGIYTRRWQAAPERAPKARAGVLRLTNVSGSWNLERLDAGRTRVTYTLLSDPGGAIPGWASNFANRRSLPELLRAVSKRAKDPSYKRRAAGTQPARRGDGRVRAPAPCLRT